MPPSRSASTGILALALGVASCAHGNRDPIAPQPASAEAVGPRAPVFEFANEDDYVVRVVSGETTCSGTLIASNQVLTAHHCVSARSSSGAILADNCDPALLRIELGGGYLPWGEVGVRAIVAPPCGFGAGVGDLAILVLDRDLTGVPTLPPELDRAPSLGLTVHPVGFGFCSATDDGIRKRARTGGQIDALRADRFRLDASICPGDSGGPALSRAGELIGVISAAVMDGSASTVGRSEFTRLDHWRPAFANARMIAEGASPAELPPIAGCPDP